MTLKNKSIGTINGASLFKLVSTVCYIKLNKVISYKNRQILCKFIYIMLYS